MTASGLHHFLSNKKQIIRRRVQQIFIEKRNFAACVTLKYTTTPTQYPNCGNHFCGNAFLHQIYTMKNKHLFIILIIVGVAAMLTSCTDRTRTYKVGVSQCSDDSWRQKMNKEMAREAAVHSANVELHFRSAGNDSKRQIRQIDSLINEGINLLIVSPNESKELTPIIEKVYAKGIPVVVVDRKVLTDKYTAFVGANNYALGCDVGSFISQELEGVGTVTEFTGQMTSSAAQERHNGFMKALEKTPGIKLLAQVDAGWDGTNATQLLDSLVRAGTVPDIVFAHTDRMGVKIHREAKKHGLNLKVVGIDGLAEEEGGLWSVENGQLTASFIYPTGGEHVMQTAYAILEGRPYERETQLSSAVINASTARIFRIQSEQIKESEDRIDELGTQLDKFLSRYSMQNMLLTSCIIIIVLIGIVLAVSLRSYFVTVRRNKELAQQKRKLEEQRDQLVSLSKELQETTQSKLTFFTEVSHDLRTPLTLIMAPIEQMQGATNLTPEQRDLLGIIRANAGILMRLVSQTLDFRKFEVGQLKLHLQHADLNLSLTHWCEPFRALARKKMIRYHVQCDFEGKNGIPVEGLIDTAKMESVVYNLLSNAFKFTPEGGRVSVKCRMTNKAEEGRRLLITIEDSGQGIDPEKIAHIFDRFYQVDASHEGSGIGLATVKAYVELHGGMVKAESAPGKGARFTIDIPCAENADELTAAGRLDMAAEHLLLHEEADVQEMPDDTPPHIDSIDSHNTVPRRETPVEHFLASSKTDSEGNDTDNLPTVLVIDDNEDIRSYVRILLGKEYRVEEAANGREGLTKARQIMPDAVVCDVMMPVMDGWECCRRLKDEWQTSHIPVMLLTACTLNEQRITGFDCGADAYIEKPFSPDMFRARLRNLLANRQRLQAFFGDKAILAQANVSELDKGFAERFRALIETHIKNSELSVEDIATEMGLGRSQLYRKVKSLTGYSPVELIRVARLKKAAEMLTRTEKTVSEVAYEVGFSTPSYLTKCFRDYFGVSPSDYVKGK